MSRPNSHAVLGWFHLYPSFKSNRRYARYCRKLFVASTKTISPVLIDSVLSTSSPNHRPPTVVNLLPNVNRLFAPSLNSLAPSMLIAYLPLNTVFL